MLPQLQGPAEPRRVRPGPDPADRGPGHVHTPGHLTVRPPLGPQAENFSDLTHDLAQRFFPTLRPPHGGKPGVLSEWGHRSI
jgi:hypothetical protein